MGAKKRPYYRIVATDTRSPRDGRFIELIGRFDPIADPKLFEIKQDRLDYWVGVGAQMTDTLAGLVRRHQEKLEASA
jgi:small subunit ribosomal protein S16